MRKVDDQHSHKGLMALAIGGASGSGPGEVFGFEPIGGCKRFGSELAYRVAVRRQPGPDPFVSCWRRPRTLCLHLLSRWNVVMTQARRDGTLAPLMLAPGASNPLASIFGHSEFRRGFLRLRPIPSAISA